MRIEAYYKLLMADWRQMRAAVCQKSMADVWHVFQRFAGRGVI
jgi:hypothetical protein